MASKSDALENLILDHILSITSYTMPANVYLALTTVVPTDASTAGTLTEANYTGYARKEILATDFPAGASSGSLANDTAITFDACTAGTSTVIGFAIVTSSSGAGTVLYWGTVTSKVIDTSNTPATVAIGALVITED